MSAFHTSKLAAGLLALLLGAAAQAQPIPRTFLSAQSGNDTYPCTAGQPCRTFSRAHTQTVPGGEILVLDSGGYGPFTISKPLRVTAAPGVYAAINVSTGVGVLVSNPGGLVTLTGLTILGQPDSTNGIRATGVGDLTVRNCHVSGMGVKGILMGTSHLGLSNLNVHDTTIEDCGQGGISIEPGQGGINALIERVRVSQCSTGIDVRDVSIVVVRDCSLTDNGTGVNASYSGNRTTLRDCLITGNNIGLYGGGTSGGNSAMILASGCVISENTTGIKSFNGNDVISFGGNQVSWNINGFDFTSTSSLK